MFTVKLLLNSTITLNHPMMKNNHETLIRIGLVDDHVILMQPFFDLLNKQQGIQCSFLVHSGEQLIQLLAAADEYPDIILMDIEMPGMDGIETTRLVTKLYPQIKVIALTGRSNPYSVIQMKEAGACTYFRKDVSFPKLTEALREVYINGRYYYDFSHQQSSTIDEDVREEATIIFSEKERELLDCMSRGCSYEEMGAEMCLSKNTIEKYRLRLTKKLHTSKQAVMVRKAMEMGVLPYQKK
jgi:DNA-binding NarL/FixJ family response regulator